MRAQEGESRAEEEERMVDTLQRAYERNAGEWERPDKGGGELPKMSVAELDKLLQGAPPSKAS